jgi:hypothetical protein
VKPEGAPEKEKATAETKPMAAASMIISDITDKRKITYASILEKSKPNISASKLISEFGYVPVMWDRLVAALTKDGATVLRTNVKVDVRKMLASGNNQREILTEACKAGGPVFHATLRRISAVTAGLALANRIKAARAENKAKLVRGYTSLKATGGKQLFYDVLQKYGIELTPQQNKSILAEIEKSGTSDPMVIQDIITKGMGVKSITTIKKMGPSKMNAGKPTLPMPTQDPGQGMIYAWNDMTKEWYVTSVTASKKIKASYKENDTLLRDGKPFARVYNVSPNWVALKLENGETEKWLPGDLAEDIESGSITVEPYKPALKK